MRKRTAGARCLSFLLFSWVMLQLADLVTTYWGLRLPSVVEANPLMATVISLPLVTIGLKMGMTLAAAAMLRYLDERCGVSSLPMLVALNVLMVYVVINNSSVIASSGAFSLPRLAGSLLAG